MNHRSNPHPNQPWAALVAMESPTAPPRREAEAFLLVFVHSPGGKPSTRKRASHKRRSYSGSLGCDFCASRLRLNDGKQPKIPPAPPSTGGRSSPPLPAIRIQHLTHPVLELHLHCLPSKHDPPQRCLRIPNSRPSGKTPARALNQSRGTAANAPMRVPIHESMHSRRLISIRWCLWSACSSCS